MTTGYLRVSFLIVACLILAPVLSRADTIPREGYSWKQLVFCPEITLLKRSSLARMESEVAVQAKCCGADSNVRRTAQCYGADPSPRLKEPRRIAR
jgi:hypothetical protein